MTRNIPTLARTRAIALCVCAATGTLTAQSVVSPADRAGFEGSSSTSYPLGRFDCRLQQLHADLGAAARTIQGHAYRRDAITLRDTVPAFQAELSVTLSATSQLPANASSQFAQNHGPNPTVVLPRTILSFPATQRPGGDPAPTFELKLPYATPFQMPAQTVAVCLDTTMYGNVLASGPNRNFSPYLDAHEVLGQGRNHQPGYRFDQGCPAAGQTTAHTGRLLFRLETTGLELDIASRDGVPTTPTDVAFTVLTAGMGLQPSPWPYKAGCTMLPTLDGNHLLPGPNDANGDWTGTLTGFLPLPVGQRYYTQLVSASLSAADLTVSDVSALVVPPPGPNDIVASRVASGSDRTSPTGTVSTTVPVTEFF